MRMPFGKYKGREVCEIPPGYLYWLRDNCNLFGELRALVEAAIEVEEQRRWEDSMPADTPSHDVVKGVYRRLARKWHPDHGGTTSAMQALNEFYDDLKRMKGGISH